MGLVKSWYQNPRNWVLPLALLGSIGLVISFVGAYVTTSTRWALLLLALVFGMATPESLRWLRTSTGRWVALALAWAMITWLWSVQPQLTLMKSGAWWLVCLALVSGGYRWACRNALQDAFGFLLPLFIVVLVAGPLGRGSVSAYSEGAGMDLYQGMTSNPNMMGSLLFMTLPLLLWRFYLNRGSQAKKWLWGILLATILVTLLITVSRSSILASCLLLGAYTLAMPMARRSQLYLLGGLAVAMVLAASPGTLRYIEGKYIRKNLISEEISPFFTREEPWEISLRMAKKGGLLGGGYGVSLDAGTFKGGFTSVGYSREKGNSQLAIVEEMGLVGLTLHLGIVFTLLKRLWQAFQREQNRDLRTLLAIVSGAIAGVLTTGLFEAWWVAPGSPESIWFWTMVGLGLGLVDRIERQRKTELQFRATTS